MREASQQCVQHSCCRQEWKWRVDSFTGPGCIAFLSRTSVKVCLFYAWRVFFFLEVSFIHTCEKREKKAAFPPQPHFCSVTDGNPVSWQPAKLRRVMCHTTMPASLPRAAALTACVWPRPEESHAVATVHVGPTMKWQTFLEANIRQVAKQITCFFFFFTSSTEHLIHTSTVVPLPWMGKLFVDPAPEPLCMLRRVCHCTNSFTLLAENECNFAIVKKKDFLSKLSNGLRSSVKWKCA